MQIENCRTQIPEKNVVAIRINFYRNRFLLHPRGLRMANTRAFLISYCLLTTIVSMQYLRGPAEPFSVKCLNTKETHTPATSP